MKPFLQIFTIVLLFANAVSGQVFINSETRWHEMPIVYPANGKKYNFGKIGETNRE